MVIDYVYQRSALNLFIQMMKINEWIDFSSLLVNGINGKFEEINRSNYAKNK